MRISQVFVLGLIITTILVASALQAQSIDPSKFAQPNPNAVRGGIINYSMQAEPPTIHPITSTDYYSSLVKGLCFDVLLDHDMNTWAWKPRLAEKWEISKNNRVFTFTLRKDAVFSDGKPVTAEDVKFSFDAIFEPQYKAANLQPYYEGIEKVEVVNPYTVKVTAKTTYFNNFNVIAGMYVIPKHIYGDVAKSMKMTRQVVGSGPYTLDKFDKGQKIVLKKNPNWYGNKMPEWKGYFNFEQVAFRFVKEDNVLVEMLKKGDIDFMEFKSPDTFIQKTQGDPWGKTVFRNQVENSYPKSYAYVGFNFRKTLFQDKNVRLALAHMMNREEMNKKFRYDMSVLATGPTYIQSEYANKDVKPMLFDPEKARAYLAKSGWKDTDKDGILDKVIDGKKVDFRLNLVHAAKEREKYWTLYKEDLKKIGVELNIELLEWNSFMKILDEGNFDLVALAWQTTIDWDPKQIWHSSSAVSGGSNFISYKNPKVDKLIEKAREEVDRKKRMDSLRKVYEMIANDVPYIFLFNDKFILYANDNKVLKPGDTMMYDIGDATWWSASP